jgi:outer membrane protein, heavy metal efflux system
MTLVRPIAFVALLAAPTPAWSQPGSTGTPVTLQELEQLALQNNPTTAVAAAEIEAARGRTQQAAAWHNPVIGYSGEELTNNHDARGQHGFFVEQTIPLGGKLRLSRDVSQTTIAQAEAVRDLQRLRVLSSVRRAFYAVLLTERQIEVEERLAALASETVGVTAQRFNVGTADRPDFLESEIESRRLQLQLNRSKNVLRAERARLAALTGVPEVAGRPLAATIEAAIPKLEHDAVIQTLLDQSPEMKAARAELERTKATTARAQRATFPDLFLRGGAAYNREHGQESGRPIGWEGAIEAGISVPLFNRNAGGITTARADETRAQAELKRLELSLRSRAETQFAEYATAEHSAEEYRTEILPRAEEAHRLYLTRYREMAAAYPQVLVSQRTLFDLSAEYLESMRQAWTAAVELQGLLAGDGLSASASKE